MPELPEVETIANGLNRRVAGDVVESIWLGEKRDLLKSEPERFADVLEGAKIERVQRVGKHIVIDVTRRRGGAAQWLVHLGMTGRMLVSSPEADLARHTHFIAKLASGRELRFIDPRRFGRLEVRPQAGFRGPGNEPLSIPFEDFAALFHGRKTPIKAALLNQKLLHGVGNIYADESLFRAGIRPKRRAASLTREELKRLHASVKVVLKQAIKAGGSSVSDYVDEVGEPGLFQVKHRVYVRTGLPCLSCRTPIKRILVAGRGTHYCPKCQQ